MNINIKATNLELTPPIREYIDIKIGSLDRFLKRFEEKNDINVFVEIARTTKHHYKGNIFRAEVDISLGGKIIRAEHEDLDIRVAIDKVEDKLKQEIKKYKEQKISFRS
jgi:putative sigma-54 modulation protein